MRSDPESLAAAIAGGSRRALARGISLVEDGTAQGEALCDLLFGRTGRAKRIGVTGPPGAGKSTLVGALTEHLRSPAGGARRVGILAIDPSSAFTGGALLGDRVRMHRVGLDDGVFIRSMATRGALGGLAAAAIDAAGLLDAAGHEVILIETVGVGQSEIEISSATDVTLVVLSPESGDSVQAMKAGLMEIADVVVMNKADREGAARAVEELQQARSAAAGRAWHPEIVSTVASSGAGVDELHAAIERHLVRQLANGSLKERRYRNHAVHLRNIIARRFEQLLESDPEVKGVLEGVLAEIEASRQVPYRAATEVLARLAARWTR